MTRIWPASLPTAIEPGYRLTPVDQSLRTDMEVGSARLRRISAARRDTVEVQWKFNDAEMHAFRAWFGDEPWSLLGESDNLAAWTKVGCTATADAAVGPGLLLADRIIETAVNSEHRIDRSLGAAAVEGSDVLLRASLKASGRGTARLGLVTRAGALSYTNLTLASGALGSQSGLVSRRSVSRGDGWWRVEIVANTGAGASDPVARISILNDVPALTYLGDNALGIDICEIGARLLTGYDLHLTTDAAGAASGAAGGSAWVQMPLAFGGGLRTVEARFTGPWQASVLPWLGWQVTGQLEVRNA